MFDLARNRLLAYLVLQYNASIDACMRCKMNMVGVRWLSLGFVDIMITFWVEL